MTSAVHAPGCATVKRARPPSRHQDNLDVRIGGSGRYRPEEATSPPGGASSRNTAELGYNRALRSVEGRLRV